MKVVSAPHVANSFVVSVVMALYNKRDYIEAALQSILSQSLAPVEIIVVDDGSTDGSDAAVLAMNIPNLTLVRTARVGPGPARNHGMALAKGDYVAFLDGDDLWLPDHLETLSQIAGTFSGAALIASGYQEFSGPVPALTARSCESAPRPLSFFTESSTKNRVSLSAVAVKPDVALHLGGFGNFIPGEDRRLWQAMALHAHIATIDRVTMLYRRHTGGIMDQVAAVEAVPDDIPPHMHQIDDYLTSHPDTNLTLAIAAYLRHEWISMLRQYLYRRHMGSARWVLRQMRVRNIAAPAHLALLASLPRQVVSTLIAAHRLRRRLFSRQAPTIALSGESNR